MRLQNIRFPEADICREEELYFHRNGEWVDFNGYFNLFYIEKRKKYTNQESLTLHLELNGCQAIRLMLDENIIQEKTLTGGKETLEMEFPYSKTEQGVFWFSVKIEKSSGAENSFEKSATKTEENSVCDISAHVKGWYEGTCQNEKPVRIAAVVCTFKREPYVFRNLKSVLRFLEEPENASLNLCYWLVDNGRTLSEHEEISRLAVRYPDTIRIIPNRNVGGAGGFTRGMIEAIEEKERLGLTHVQMMDDDAVMDPELFVRAYGFLGMRKDEWEDITLGGSLLREDFPYIQQASGEWFKDFAVQNDFPLADLRDYKTCTESYMCEAAHKNTPYSGWWCCCMSLNVVREDNLPIPLFLHHDDIEFGIRNQKNGIVFLNGFGVWHKGFELTFPGVNTYYDVRNTLITTVLTQPEKSRWEILKWVWKRITVSVIEFRYGEMKLVYQAFRDFCKGPEWLYKTDAEKLNNWLRDQVKMEPIQDLEKELTAEEYLRIRQYIQEYKDSYGMKNVRNYFSPARKMTKLIKKVTFNGWLLPAKKEVIPLSPIDPPFDAFRRNRIVLFEPFSGKCLVGSRRYSKLVQAVCMYISTGINLKKLVQAEEAYRKGVKKITREDAWKRYLKIRNESI